MGDEKKQSEMEREKGQSEVGDEKRQSKVEEEKGQSEVGSVKGESEVMVMMDRLPWGVRRGFHVDSEW